MIVQTLRSVHTLIRIRGSWFTRPTLPDWGRASTATNASAVITSLPSAAQAASWFQPRGSAEPAASAGESDVRSDSPSQRRDQLGAVIHHSVRAYPRGSLCQQDK